MLIKHRERCRQKQEITAITTSDESHLYRKNHFHTNPIFFKVIADFEADNEIDNSNIGTKRTNIYKQNPILSGYFIIPVLEEILKSGFKESLNVRTFCAK